MKSYSTFSFYRGEITSELDRYVKKGSVLECATKENGRFVTLYYCDKDQLMRDRTHEVFLPSGEIDERSKLLIEDAIDELAKSGVYNPGSPYFLDLETIAAEAGLDAADSKHIAPGILKSKGWYYLELGNGKGWKFPILSDSEIRRLVWNLPKVSESENEDLKES